MDIIVNSKCAFDEYNTEGYKFDLKNPLTDFQIDFIYNTFPNTKIMNADYTKTEWLPCPIRLKLLIDDEINIVYLRMTRFKNAIKNEAYILPILKNLGLNVPILYSAPAVDLALPQIGEMILISEIPGKDIYGYFNLDNKEENDNAKRIILEGVTDLYSLTDDLKNLEADKVLPVVTLKDELDAIKKEATNGSPILYFYKNLNY